MKPIHKPNIFVKIFSYIADLNSENKNLLKNSGEYRSDKSVIKIYVQGFILLNPNPDLNRILIPQRLLNYIR